MRERIRLPFLQVLAVSFGIFLLVGMVHGQDPAPAAASPAKRVLRAGTPAATRAKACAACIRGHMEFLASDALRGRGSATHDELVAATYVAAQLRAYGIDPAGDDGGYLQKAPLVQPKFSAAPTLKFSKPAAGAQTAEDVVWTHGKEMLVLYLSKPEFAGALARIDSEAKDAKVAPGAVIVVSGTNDQKIQGAVSNAVSQGAAGVIVPASANAKAHWDARGQKLPNLAPRLAGGKQGAGLGGGDFNVVALNDDSFNALKNIPDGTAVKFSGDLAAVEKNYTWNAVGILRGRSKVLGKQAILLTAHLDHLGVGRPVKGDEIYNGADDDASGTTAVLELARALAAGPKPARTVVFALFGSEESGGLGSSYFLEHPPVPLTDIVANLEFEMIGRPDPKYPKDDLWLSGWERSNLGPTLAAHGAKLVADERPDQHFFERSDNFVLAKKGVVAQTASSFGLHEDYHQPSDDVTHIDFTHMTAAIQSLIGPVEWLVNTSFRPAWVKGGKP